MLAPNVMLTGGGGAQRCSRPVERNVGHARELATKALTTACPRMRPHERQHAASADPCPQTASSRRPRRQRRPHWRICQRPKCRTKWPKFETCSQRCPTFKVTGCRSTQRGGSPVDRKVGPKALPHSWHSLAYATKFQRCSRRSHKWHSLLRHR